MTLLANFRKRRIDLALGAYRSRYTSPIYDEAVVAQQLMDLNAAWKESLLRSPWARLIQQKENLPECFASWDDFDARAPVMDKRQIRKALENAGATSGNVNWRATGGSTSEPFRFPVWPDEASSSALDIWLGRERLGISPADPAYLLWGHAHLLGSGLRGAINRLKRTILDRALGYTRVSAYALTPASLETAWQQLMEHKPRYVIGYSSALDRFARHNADRAPEIAKLKLKAIIATAEAFPRADSAEVVSRTFGAPVAMEYGTVETGPLAYQDIDGSYPVFHARHRLSLRGGDGPDANEILVTSLYPRALPLLRYALGDLAETDPEDIKCGCVLRLRGISGRCNDIVNLPNGSAVHSEVFTHCVRDIADIEAFQVVAADGVWPRLRYVSSMDLSIEASSEIRRRLALIDRAMGNTELERVDAIPLTVAGKHRMIVES
ncbi:hypothetical protein KUV46_12020 [Thalassovita mediterranea]|nr:hypothetical protein KUV46_12020 [Thalassovita mediterranea]